MAQPNRRSPRKRPPPDPARAGPTRPSRRPKLNRGRSGRWKHGAIPVLGLVGGIGAGKSKVAKALADRGATVLDADAIGHALLDQRPTREEVVAQFGNGVLDPADPEKINRKVLGAIVFANSKKLRELERILHPRMRRTFIRAIHRHHRKASALAIVLDAAVLFEAGWDDLCDLVAFVEAPREVRLARVAASRGWSAEDLQAREQSQLPLEQKQARADLLVRNSGDDTMLVEDLDALCHRLRLTSKSSEPPDSPSPKSGGSRRSPESH